MSALPAAVVAWCALGAAALLVPAPSAAGLRVAVLRRAGRLAAGPVRREARRGRVSVLGAALVACVGRSALVPGVTAGGCVSTVAGPALGVAAGVLTATVAGVVHDLLRRRRAEVALRRLLDALRMLVSEVESGSRPADALAAASAMTPDWGGVLGAAAASARTGNDVAPVLARGARDGPAAGRDAVDALGHAWRVAGATGAPVADVLGRLARDVEAAHERRRAVAAALAGPRSSTALLAALPAVGLSLGVAMGARPVAILLGTPPGQVLCCVGVVLAAAGVAWTRRITTRAER